LSGEKCLGFHDHRHGVFRRWHLQAKQAERQIVCEKFGARSVEDPPDTMPLLGLGLNSQTLRVDL
jgi:hypothetical protein